MFKKLFSHTLIYGLSPQIVKVAQVLVLPLITPFLTPLDYGVFGLITAVIGAVSVFSTLGLSVVLANSFVKSPNQFKWLWRQIYGFLIYWNIFYALIVSIVIYFFIPLEAKNNSLNIILLNVLPLVLFSSSTVLGNLYYQLKQKPMQIAVRNIVIGLFTVVLNVYLIKYLHLGYMGWFIANGVAQIIYQISYYYPLNFKLGIKPIFNFKKNTIFKQLRISFPTIPHYYSNYILTSFDKIIMKFIGLPIDQIGKYNAAQVPGNLFASATYAANQAISPLLLETYKTNNKKLERRLNFNVIILFLVLTSIISLFLKELLPLIIKSEGLEEIYKITIIIIMAYNYRPMYVASNNKLFYVEKTKALLKVTSIAAVMSIILNLILIYFFGSIAAAITLFITFMYMGYSGFYIKEFKENDGTDHKPLFWLILTIGLTLFVYFAVEFSLFIKVGLALIFLLVGIYLLFKLNRNNEISNN